MDGAGIVHLTKAVTLTDAELIPPSASRPPWPMTAVATSTENILTHVCRVRGGCQEQVVGVERR